MKTHEVQKFQEHLAQWFYETATSFSRVENDEMLKALKVLRPDISIPSRVQLSESMLHKAFIKMKGKVDKIVKKCHYITGGTDGWSDINQEPVINHMEIGSIYSFQTVYCKHL